jgi:hypothetical protein
VRVQVGLPASSIPKVSGCVADPNLFEIGAAMPGHYGADPTGVTLADTTIGGAWNVQGDPRRPELLAAARQAFGLELPTTPNTTTRTEAWTALWLGPASWLVVASGESPLADADAVCDTLSAAGAAMFDVSTSRVADDRRPKAATVLPRAVRWIFTSVHCRGHLRAKRDVRANALFYRRSASPTFTMLVARALRGTWHALVFGHSGAAATCCRRAIFDH